MKICSSKFKWNILKTFLWLHLLVVLALQAEEKHCKAHNHKTICLNMIVRNESEVIEKCLNSVKPLIDYWVIVDTGSTDGTQEIIKKCMAGIPGDLHERPWVNFAHNRNEALELGKDKADYLLLIDADECLIYDESFSLPTLDKDCYYLPVRQIGSADCMRASLINAKFLWKWVGVLHEVLEGNNTQTCGILRGVTNLCNTNAPSGRSKDPNKYLKDAAVLEEALKEEPNNSRYMFYLGQSYAAAKEYALALKAYEKRAKMPSTDYQETFFAIYTAGKMKQELGDHEGALESFFKAYEFHPGRAEPLLQAAIVYRDMGNPFLGYLLTKEALTMPRPNDTCIEYGAYDYRLLLEFANCSLLTGRWQDGLDASQKLLQQYPSLPNEIKQSIRKNCEIAKGNLAAKTTHQR